MGNLHRQHSKNRWKTTSLKWLSASLYFGLQIKEVLAQFKAAINQPIRRMSERKIAAYGLLKMTKKRGQGEIWSIMKQPPFRMFHKESEAGEQRITGMMKISDSSQVVTRNFALQLNQL